MCRSILWIRSVVRPALTVGFLAAIAPLPAAGLELEPYLVAAYRDGSLGFATGIGCVAVVGQDCPVSASTEDGDDEAWGLGAAVRVNGPWWFDLRWSKQDTEARYFGLTGEPLLIPPTPLEISHLHAGVLYRFLEGHWSPFTTVFGGISHIDARVETSQRAEIDLDRASGGLGGGLLIDLGSRVGLRVEVRGVWTSLPEEFDGDLEQVEGSVGLRFRI